MPFAPVDDISIYYEVHGERGTPLLMIAGFGASKADWPADWLAALHSRHCVVLFDNRGVGRTIDAGSPFSMAQLAADAVGLMDFLGIEQVHVLGMSMGGMVAQQMALLYPDRVRSLVLGATAPGGPGHPELVSPEPQVMMDLTRPSSGDRTQDVRDRWWMGYTPAFIEANRDLLEDLLAARLAYPEAPEQTRQLQMLALLQTHDTLNQLPDIRCPTLIQSGTDDILVPSQNSHIMAERIPRARLIEYPGCAHGFYLESGGKATHDLLTFLAQFDSADAA